MPTNRFQFSDDFVLNNGNVGINSASPQAKLDVVSSVNSDNLRVTGISSFTSYEGFLNNNQNINQSITISGDRESGSLSGEIIVGTGVTVTVASGATSSQGFIDSLKVYNTFTVPVGGTADRPAKVSPGQLFFNRDFATMEFWDGNVWKQVDNTTQSGRGVFGGGVTPASISTIEFINISSTGNSLNFGNFSSVKTYSAACSSTIRGIYGGNTAPSYSNVIDYITIASESNSLDFGDLTANKAFMASCSSSTRGLFSGGYTPYINNIDYIQISTLGNALDFGDISRTVLGGSGLSNSTRAIFSGGYVGPAGFPISELIESVTISSLGNATYFGDLTVRRAYSGSVSSPTKGLFAGGVTAGAITINSIDSIIISTYGDAINFGDLSAARRFPSGVSSSTRGVFSGGGLFVPAGQTNLIDYVTIASSSNALDFGDLSSVKQAHSGCSDSHGGLGGF